ncbi:MAG: SusC/RagA family TonB-linked outer membrane protein [Chitinophagales bacterium]
MKQKLLAVLLTCFASVSLFSQRTISGMVTSSKDKQPLIGATVIVEKTTIGTTTDLDGKYTLQAQESATNLVVSYVGMTAKVVPITGNTINVVLDDNEKMMKDVVVTALGVKREKASLGYSTTTVKSEELNSASPGSALSALQGKVAGAQITNSTGAPGGSTRVVLRGGSSLTGDNNALIVVDGVPIDNSNFGFDDVLNNQYDAGSRINDLNPQDIENVTILKGAAAVALYGQRGANGAILYTTKRGKLTQQEGGRPWKVSINSTVSFSNPLKMPENQNEWGQGGEKQPDSRENFSWGPRFDGSIRPWGQVVNDSQRVKPYVGLPNNHKQFFQTGVITNNNVSLSGATKNSTYYLSYNNYNYKGIVPGTGYQRNSIKMTLSHDFGDKLSVFTSFNYAKTGGDLVNQGQSENSPYFDLLNIPRDIPVQELKDLNNPFNTPAGYFGNYYPNPYWMIANQKTTNDVDRFLANFTVDYKPTKWLTMTGRLGTDFSSDWRYQRWRRVEFTNRDQNKVYPGRYWEDNYKVNDINADIIIRASKTFKDKFTIGGLLGTNIYHNKQSHSLAHTSGLAIEDYYNLQNSLDRPDVYNESFTRRLVGLYGEIDFAYKSIFFLTVTGRNDWSSTLPKNKNSYFYPSVSGSFVITELAKINPMIISYWKIRASYAVIGKDAAPYSLRNVFSRASISDGYFESEVHAPFYNYVDVDGDGIPDAVNNVTGYAMSNVLRNPNLKPEISNTWEVGTEINFLKDHLSVDFTYYWKRSVNEIVEIPAAPSSGYTNRIVNAGIFSNKGVELAARIIPVNTKGGFKWELYGTFTKNWSRVDKVSDAASQINLGGLSSMAIVAQTGQPYGAFYSVTSLRDPNGNPVVDSATGKPLISSTPQIVGNFQPNYLASFGTTLSWKGLRFNILFDVRQGGKFYSSTRDLQQFVGTDPLTLYNNREDFVVPNSVYKGSDGQYHTNTTKVHYQDYWTNYMRQDYSYNLVDASFIKLREVSLSYALPSRIFKNNKVMSGLELSVFGNNLVMWVSKQNTYSDPEVNASGASNEQGFEVYNLPSLRSIGFGLKADF